MRDEMERAPRAVRAAAILFAVPGLAFALSTPLVLAYQARRGELPMTPFGFRLLGGPFEQLGTDRLTALGSGLAWILVGVSAVDVVAGIWLWRGQRRGAVLGLATSPLTFGLAAGFVLPILLAAVPIRAVLVVVGRHGLR